MALVLFAHGLCVLFLLAPATPWKDKRLRRERAAGRQAVAVFLEAGSRARPLPSREKAHPASARVPGRRPERPKTVRAAVARAASTAAPVQPRRPLVTTLPRHASGAQAQEVPAYIPGGRAFQRNLHAARRRERRDILPGNLVAGMPRFTMKDPRTSGLSGLARFVLYGVIGAPDPVCVQAENDFAMPEADLHARHVDLSKIKEEASLHHCVFTQSSWLDPQGPATHLHANPGSG